MSELKKMIYLYDMINKLASYKPFLIQIMVQSCRRDALRNIWTVKDLYKFHLCWLSPSTDELFRLHKYAKMGRMFWLAKLSFCHKLLSCGHNLVSRGLKLVSCGHKLLSCGHNLVSRGLKLVSCGHNIN